MTTTIESQDEITGSELLVCIENGEDAEVLDARIQTLSQRNFIQVWQAVQTLDAALSSYAESWRDARDWGQGGVPFPAERAMAKAA